MSKKKWEDVTLLTELNIYKYQNTWQVKLDKLCLSVYRSVLYPKDVWLLNCVPFYNHHKLTSKDIEFAKYEALALVTVALKREISILEG